MTIAEQLHAEGRSEGRSEGVAEGDRRRAIASVFTVLETRALLVTAEARRRIEACDDVEVLNGWLVRAVTAKTVDDLFEA